MFLSLSNDLATLPVIVTGSWRSVFVLSREHTLRIGMQQALRMRENGFS